MRVLDLPSRVATKIQITPEGCWRWTARLDRDGYGRARIGDKTGLAHRLIYAIANGPIPAGLETDHLCHSRDESCVAKALCPHRACVNPEHLELVTHRENVIRKPLSPTCRRGHLRTDENTRTYRSQRGGITRRCLRCAALIAESRSRSI